MCNVGIQAPCASNWVGTGGRKEAVPFLLLSLATLVNEEKIREQQAMRNSCTAKSLQIYFGHSNLAF